MLAALLIPSIAIAQSLEHPLRQGDSGVAVTVVQQKLAALGYYQNSINGFFTVRTEQAVTRFQRDQGLVANGIVDTQTWSVLHQKVPTSDSASSHNLQIQYGDRGDRVVDIQQALVSRGYNVSVTGQFDAQTATAVKSFQQDNGLQVDGVVGPSTAVALGLEGASSSGGVGIGGGSPLPSPTPTLSPTPIPTLNPTPIPSLSPTVPPPKSTELDAMQAVIDSLERGEVAYRIPPVMQVGRTERITAAIAREVTADIEKRLQGRGQTQTASDIEVRAQMTLKLTGEEGAFLITPKTPEEQTIAPERGTFWDWDVVPQKTNYHYLTLTAYVKLPDSNAQPLSRIVYQDRVQIQANLPNVIQRAFQDARKDVVAILIALGGGGGMLAIWLAWHLGKGERATKDQPERSPKTSGISKRF